MNFMRVVFGEDYVQIVDFDGIEVVYWDISEWIEDPQVVFSIANAVHLMHSDPDRLRHINRRHMESIRNMEVNHE